MSKNKLNGIPKQKINAYKAVIYLIILISQQIFIKLLLFVMIHTNNYCIFIK